MARRVLAITALVAWALTSSAFAQNDPSGRGGRAGGGGPMRPPLFFSESWKALPTPTDDHGEWPAGQAGVASPNLQLSLHGPSHAGCRTWPGRRLSAQPVDRRDDVSNRGDASRQGQLRRSHRPAGKNPLGRAHVGIPPDPAAHQAGRWDVAGRRPYHRPQPGLQSDRRLDCRHALDEDRLPHGWSPSASGSIVLT